MHSLFSVHTAALHTFKHKKYPNWFETFYRQYFFFFAWLLFLPVIAFLFLCIWSKIENFMFYNSYGCTKMPKQNDKSKKKEKTLKNETSNYARGFSMFVVDFCFIFLFSIAAGCYSTFSFHSWQQESKNISIEWSW